MPQQSLRRGGMGGQRDLDHRTQLQQPPRRPAGEGDMADRAIGSNRSGAANRAAGFCDPVSRSTQAFNGVRACAAAGRMQQAIAKLSTIIAMRRH
ncbi:hypothetical protein WR25_04744 [Diploscapter pachys]|uniref:Uncharacterized protein n=1 Tax=Diploscapter pachys TaxID=2018661 RepID=A0A2A2KHW0_9BILA|nr:hypothetical protein WR25_04744 [Diploscapter pachys]